jgi:hypothetical protein
MARPATPDIKISEGLQPVAVPLGLYIRPATPEPSPLHGVAQALMSLSSDLQSWGKEQQQEQQQADFLRGQADFLSKTEGGYAEGVRTGEIPANASPFYQRGYNQAMGSAAGYQLEGIFGSSYDKWEGKNSADPADFDKWFADTAKGSIQNNNPYFLKGVLPHLREIQNRYHDKWRKTQEANAVYKAQAGFGAAAAGAIDDVMTNWRQDAKAGILRKPDIDGLSASMEEIRQRGFQMGMRQEQIDNAIIDAIQAKTLQYRDPELLKLLDGKSTAGPKFSATPYGRDVKLKTTQALTELWKKEATEERLQQEREDKLAANQAKSTIVEQLLKDPKAPLDEEQIKRVQKVDGDFKLDIMQWRDKILQSQTADDPRKVNQLFTDILSGGDGMEKLTRAIRSGDVQSKETVSTALSFIKGVQEFTNSKSGILQTAASRSYITQLETLGQDPELSMNRLAGDPATLTQAGRQALNNYRYGLMQWGLQNPNASVLDQEKFATELGEQIIKAMPKGADITAPRVYTPPPSLRNIPQVFTPENVQQGAQQMLQQMQQGGAPQPQAPQAPQAPQFSPEDMAKIQQKAQQLGVTPEVIIKRLQDMGVRPSAPAAPEKRSDLTPGSPDALGGVRIPASFAPVARQVAEQLGLTPRSTGGAEPPQQVGSNPEMLNTARASRILSSPVGGLVQEVAQRSGMDPQKLAVMVSIESGGRPTVSTGSYHGLLQLSEAEFSKFGGTDIFDPKQNLEAGVKIIQQKEARFKAEFGREPTVTELYLMHQQGEAGLRAHMKNGDGPAWEAMASTGEGQRKGEGWAKRAVWGNVPSDMRHYFGSVDNISSREFMAVWTAKLLGISYERALAQVGVGGSRG